MTDAPTPGQDPAQYPAAGAPAYNSGYGTGPTRTNTLAIVGFILAFFISIAGLIVSIIARNQIKRTGEGGSGLALAGIIISIVGIVFFVIYIIVVIAVAASVGAGAGTGGY